MSGSTSPARRFLAVCPDPPPPGFESLESSAALDGRALRGGLVAVWAPEPAEVWAQLEPLRERIRGVLLTVGDEPGHERLGPSLWQLRVSPAAIPGIRALAEAWLDICENYVAARRDLDRANLAREREQADRARLLEKIDRETGAMREKLHQRTQWTAQVMTRLVHFAAETLPGLAREGLDQALVEFLMREPFTHTGAAVLALRAGSWTVLAERGQWGDPAELPAPGACVSLLEPSPSAALVQIGTPTGERLLAVQRLGALDDADRSVLSLFGLMLAGHSQTSELNYELSKVLSQRDALIRELSSPVIEVWHDTVCLPVVGSVDRKRALEMTQVLLEAVSVGNKRHVIIDFTGIGVMDTQTVHHFASLTRALRMIGAQCVITGVSPSIAQTMVALGVELGTARTLPSVKAAIAARLRGPVRP